MLLGLNGLASAGEMQSTPASPFAVARIYFEYNATDGDAEVVIEVKGGHEGLAKLEVVSPDGRTVIDFTAPDASKSGIRQFRFESPEPKDMDSLKMDYPEGVYTFRGKTKTGDNLFSQSRLNSRLPSTVSFLNPGHRASEVAVQDAEIRWTPVKNSAGYIIEIEQDEPNVSITAKLHGSATVFAVPARFLVQNKEYKLSIGTLNEDGNIAFVETTFTTAGSKK
jgi:hypothetical protein